MTDTNRTPHIGETLRNALPRLTETESQALESSITTHGMLDPIKVTPDGVILDGHHRHEIATRLGIEVPTKVLEITDSDEQLRFAIEANFARRNLTPDQKRELVQKLRSLGRSVRVIAEMTGIPKSTVGDMVRPVSDTPADIRAVTDSQLVVYMDWLTGGRVAPLLPAGDEDWSAYHEILQGISDTALDSLIVVTQDIRDRHPWRIGESVFTDLDHLPSETEARRIAADMKKQSREIGVRSEYDAGLIQRVTQIAHDNPRNGVSPKMPMTSYLTGYHRLGELINEYDWSTYHPRSEMSLGYAVLAQYEDQRRQAMIDFLVRRHGETS